VQRVCPDRQDLAGGVERDLGVDHLVAAVIIAEQRVGARSDPFHGTAALARRPQH
jgi:hypothetical protein